MCVCVCKTFPDTGGQNRSPEWSGNGFWPRAAWWKRTKILVIMQRNSRMAGLTFLLVRAGQGCSVRGEPREPEPGQVGQASGGYGDPLSWKVVGKVALSILLSSETFPWLLGGYQGDRRAIGPWAFSLWVWVGTLGGMVVEHQASPVCVHLAVDRSHLAGPHTHKGFRYGLLILSPNEVIHAVRDLLTRWRGEGIHHALWVHRITEAHSLQCPGN